MSGTTHAALKDTISAAFETEKLKVLEALDRHAAVTAASVDPMTGTIPPDLLQVLFTGLFQIFTAVWTAWHAHAPAPKP